MSSSDGKINRREFLLGARFSRGKRGIEHVRHCPIHASPGPRPDPRWRTSVLASRSSWSGISWRGGGGSKTQKTRKCCGLLLWTH